jgi:DNA-binding GntR family transcriptional regulator
MGTLSQAPSLSEQLADHLGQQIIRGELAPGERLREQDLSRSLDVSTNTLREAFRLLEKRHLIEHLPRRGTRVREVNEAEVRELYDFLFLLLSHLAGQAARIWQPGELEDLVNLLPELEKHHQANDIAAAHDVAFEVVHRALRFAHNRYLRDDIEDLLPLLKRFSYIALQEETTEFDVSLEIFKRLMANVMARDIQAAAADIREYGENQCRIVLRAVAKRYAA